MYTRCLRSPSLNKIFQLDYKKLGADKHTRKLPFVLGFCFRAAAATDAGTCDYTRA